MHFVGSYYTKNFSLVTRLYVDVFDELFCSDMPVINIKLKIKFQNSILCVSVVIVCFKESIYGILFTLKEWRKPPAEDT